MNNKKKVAVILGVLLVFIFLVNLNTKIAETNEGATSIKSAVEKSQEPQDPPPKKVEPSIRYFSQSSDKVVLQADTETLYTDNPTTKLTYSAVDGSNKAVTFRDGNRAFVRILGVTKLFTDNTEIFHPESGGVKDNTIFSGNITISDTGTYLVKICLGKNINLDSEGNMIWPFGCFEDSTSVQIKVYDN